MRNSSVDIELQAKRNDKSLKEMTLEEMDEIWNKAKSFDIKKS